MKLKFLQHFEWQMLETKYPDRKSELLMSKIGQADKKKKSSQIEKKNVKSIW